MDEVEEKDGQITKMKRTIGDLETKVNKLETEVNDLTTEVEQITCEKEICEEHIIYINQRFTENDTTQKKVIEAQKKEIIELKETIKRNEEKYIPQGNQGN